MSQTLSPSSSAPASARPSAPPSAFVHPAHPRRVDAIPLGADWIYEALPAHSDRVQIHVRAGQLRLFNAHGGAIANPPRFMTTMARSAPDLVIEAWLSRPGRPVMLVLTDLLACAGEDVSRRGFLERRRRLDTVIDDIGVGAMRGSSVSPLMVGAINKNPPTAFRWARRPHAAHRPGWSLSWVECRPL